MKILKNHWLLCTMYPTNINTLVKPSILYEVAVSNLEVKLILFCLPGSDEMKTLLFIPQNVCLFVYHNPVHTVNYNINVMQLLYICML